MSYKEKAVVRCFAEQPGSQAPGCEGHAARAPPSWHYLSGNQVAPDLLGNFQLLGVADKPPEQSGVFSVF